MKKCLLIWAGLGLCTVNLWAWSAPEGEVAFTNDSKTVTLSTTAASPTLICSRDTFVQRTYIVNTSSFSIAISSVPTNISTSTSFLIPAVPTGTSAVIFSPDGVNAPWWGSIYALAPTSAITPPSLSVLRVK